MKYEPTKLLINCPGIHLNVGTGSKTANSGQYLSLAGFTDRTYDVVPTWRWFKENEPDKTLASGDKLVFPSIRVCVRAKSMLHFSGYLSK